MEIKNAQYNKSLNNSSENVSINALVDGQQMSIPLDPDNRHYAEILRQVKEEGLTIKDAE